MNSVKITPAPSVKQVVDEQMPADIPSPVNSPRPPEKTPTPLSPKQVVEAAAIVSERSKKSATKLPS